MVVRPLPVQLQKIAEKELNEVPDQVQQNLDYIKDWLSKQPHIKARTDDQWLLAFLRGCKFSLERTKEKLDLFYSVRKIAPEFFANRDPLSPEIQAVLNKGIFAFLPKKLNEPGPAMFLTYSDNKVYPEDIPATAMAKVMLMALEILYMEDDNCTVVGQCAMAHVDHLSYKYGSQLSASFIKKLIMCIENVYPTRIKSIIFVNTPSFIVTIYNTFKFLLTDKLRKRVSVYSEENASNAYKAIPISILPKEFGGEGPSHAENAAQFKRKIESYRDWFLEDAQYGTDESKRVGKPKLSQEVFGIEGSFRKLNLD